jgi:hypothetical protein
MTGMNGSSPTIDQQQVVDDLRAVNHTLGKLVSYTARMIRDAEGKSRAEQLLDECRSLLALVPTPDGIVALDAWRLDETETENLWFRRWVICDETTVFGDQDIVATVVTAGVQSVHITEDGEIGGITLDRWCLQVDVTHTLDSEQSLELAAALGKHSDFLKRIEPESVTPTDELARRRKRR